MTILRIDSSANTETSVTRDLTDKIVATLGKTSVITRDLAISPLPQITHTWTKAREVPKAERSDAQRAALAQSDALIEELRAAETLVIGLPVYNFSVPAALKAWIDLIARAGETFRYTENGPEGLLSGKRAILAVASGGTPVGSDIDFATGYMRHVLGFIGITDVSIVAADKLAFNPEETIADAHQQIKELALAA
ncbi:FMN-dependent NADH-azoreductase [Sulfitobacter sp. JBTF-M27]|jgi:FMN-dependent NADH-azoreductase|uniref:FMN dependent NADH:quinone oxidoreductase n=1 Tax=Sulfitobacter sediminilitoris TaxID=2698830 RepID=A0A6P0CCK3_9RHOB|nr:NAD(P)H-dependent oxidoreductase [Sulfitobacter sediminilitoris]NEK23080.1 FMN-dependent NADH-azoreductase [Sulfitobacter sediminilitoris]